MDIQLELVRRTDPRYQIYRDKHYIPNRGTHGQQLHYLILVDNENVGIISGASAVYGCAPRDAFFNLSKTQKTKQIQLNGIVNNVVFRLERHTPNLASQIMAKWRKRIAKDWRFIYEVDVVGFETFVIEENRGGSKDRHGGLYRADNWTYVGKTQGNTKVHGKGGLTASHGRQQTERKLIWCYKIKAAKLPETYESSWKNEKRGKARLKRRNELFAKQPFYLRPSDGVVSLKSVD